MKEQLSVKHKLILQKNCAVTVQLLLLLVRRYHRRKHSHSVVNPAMEGIFSPTFWPRIALLHGVNRCPATIGLD
jgi:hypothetical protein